VKEENYKTLYGVLKSYIFNYYNTWMNSSLPSLQKFKHADFFLSPSRCELEMSAIRALIALGSKSKQYKLIGARLLRTHKTVGSVFHHWIRTKVKAAQSRDGGADIVAIKVDSNYILTYK